MTYNLSKSVLVLLFLLMGCAQNSKGSNLVKMSPDPFVAPIETLVIKQDSYVNGTDEEITYDSKASLKIKNSTAGAFHQMRLRLVKPGNEEVSLVPNITSTDWIEKTLNWGGTPEKFSGVDQGTARRQDTVYRREAEDATKRPAQLFYEDAKIDAVGDIELSRYISSNMVIQRSQSFPFRGRGPAGEIVELDFEREGVHYTHSTIIDASGNFRLNLEPLRATTKACSATLQLKGYPETKISLDNILVGDVWFAGGQSNMEKKVDYMLGAQQVIADADKFTNIRGFRASYNDQPDPLNYIRSDNESWFVYDSNEVDRASAVAYIFAKQVYKNTGVPIGLMQAYVGGTEIETWISEDKIKNDPDLEFVKNRIAQLNPTADKAYQRYPSVNYNGMINPLTNYPIKGFLFYQGESNKKRATEYENVFKGLIENWRSKWGLGALPFYYVQLPNIGMAEDGNYEDKPLRSDTWQMLREQQLRVLKDKSLKNLGMAVTIETNKEHLNPEILTRIHPQNKRPVGERLAKIALKEQYGQDLMAYSPFPIDYHTSGNKLYITFENVGDGLKIREGKSELEGFAVAGTDGVYHEASATIESSNEVSLSSSSVSNPVNAAYGWSRDPICTLNNSADLPASPFRTDDEELFDQL